MNEKKIYGTESVVCSSNENCVLLCDKVEDDVFIETGTEPLLDMMSASPLADGYWDLDENRSVTCKLAPYSSGILYKKQCSPVLSCMTTLDNVDETIMQKMVTHLTRL